MHVAMYISHTPQSTRIVPSLVASIFSLPFGSDAVEKIKNIPGDYVLGFIFHLFTPSRRQRTVSPETHQVFEIAS